MVWVTGACGSVSALHTQLGLGGELNLLVNELRLLLSQRPLHVTVADTITVAPPPGPEGDIIITDRALPVTLSH